MAAVTKVRILVWTKMVLLSHNNPSNVLQQTTKNTNRQQDIELPYTSEPDHFQLLKTDISFRHRKYSVLGLGNSHHEIEFNRLHVCMSQARFNVPCYNYEEA